MKSLSKNEAPVDYRCESMQFFSKPNRLVCNDNVIAKKGDLILCCDQFEGYTDDKGEWERFICTENVRAQHGNEYMWANKATFILSVANIILTGHPQVKRGKSILQGERIVIDTQYDRIHIEKPHGRMQPKALTTKEPIEINDNKLPKVCPIPPAPKPSP